MLPTRINTKAPEILKAYIANIRTLVKNPNSTRDMALAVIEKYQKELQKETGLNIFLTLSNTLNAAAWGSLFTYGHSSTRATVIPEIKRYTERKITADLASDFKVDLNRMKFSGKLTKEHESFLDLGLVLFDRRVGLTDEEILAFSLHELGHLISHYLHLGEYVLINQYITNAIEVFQGNSSKVKDVEIYTKEWLEQNLSEAELKDFVYGKADKDEAVKVALSAVRHLPRKHITASDFSSTVREEQFADLFAARLGYARASATGGYKLDKIFGSEALKRPPHAILSGLATAIAVVVTLPFMPLLAIGAFFESTPDEHLFAKQYRYDEEKERVTKFQRELVFQIRTSENDSERKRLMEDLKVVEHCVSLYNKVDRNFYEAIRNIVNYKWRKHEQLHKKERVLEQLVNNDIFVKSYKLT